ncbi:MAG: PCMD domain-containing protein [Odoribacter sp.]
MKKLFLYLSLSFLLASCIQNEALNTEADIESCTVLNEEGKADPHIKGNVLVNNTQIIAQANPKINLASLALHVKLTEGATISPNPRELRDYSWAQHFVVTSQDGVWNKKYTVMIDTFEMPTSYDFEFFELNAAHQYQVFYEKVYVKKIIMESDKDTVKIDTFFKQYIWASGNSGYALTGVGKTAEDYPTVSLKSEKGRGIKLETKSTGGFGEMAKMPIAAGNLFLGVFDVSNAMLEARKATLFGLPFGRKPLSFTGRYKFKRGAVLTDIGNNGKPVPVAGEDVCDIYAILYESAGLDKNALNGDNVLNNDHIIAMARLKRPTVYAPETDMTKISYENFDIQFDYDSYKNKRSFDGNKSRNYEYNLAIVFTSSVDGAYFKGAVGSTLYVDEVKVVCE